MAENGHNVAELAEKADCPPSVISTLLNEGFSPEKAVKIVIGRTQIQDSQSVVDFSLEDDDIPIIVDEIPDELQLGR